MSAYERQDHLYKQAKSEGYRSRAAFKLIELDQKYGLLKSGMKILDLGAWPGGWMQVAAQRIGAKGIVVGLDLVAIEGFGAENVKTLMGDAREDQVIDEACASVGGQFDLVLSDMSPKLTGIREVDECATVACAELALFVAGKVLRPGGNLVIKVFKSNETEQFVKNARPRFNKLLRSELKSTRKTSNEFYVLGLGIRQPES